MTPSTSQKMQHTLEAVLVMLLDSLASAGGPVRVSLFVGRDRGAVRLAESARDDGGGPQAEPLASTDWPLEVNREPIGFLRFATPGAADERVSTATLAAIAAELAREEPRVMDLVIGLAYMATLADHFRNADAGRSRRRGA